MNSTKQKPTKPGWYWYRDDVCGVAAVEVFWGSEYYGGELIAFAPEYNFLPSVKDLDGDWSTEPIAQPPPWIQKLSTNAGTDARGKPSTPNMP